MKISAAYINENIDSLNPNKSSDNYLMWTQQNENFGKVLL